MTHYKATKTLDFKEKVHSAKNKHKLVHISCEVNFPLLTCTSPNIDIDIGLLKHQQEAMVKMSQRQDNHDIDKF